MKPQRNINVREISKNKCQIPNNLIRSLEFGIYLVFGACDLVFINSIYNLCS